MGGDVLFLALFALPFTHAAMFVWGTARGWNDACRHFKCERSTDAGREMGGDP